MPDAIKNFVKEHKGRIKVALDVDEVMAHSFLLVAEKINKQYGTNYTIENLKDYPSTDKIFLCVTNSEFNKIYDESWVQDWERIRKLADNKILVELSASFDVDIVSSRGEEAAEPLREWLALNYPEMINRIIIVKKYGDKSILPYQIYIDDAPRLAEAIENTDGKMVLLVDKPYNRYLPDTEKVVRVADVNDACSKLLAVLPVSK